MILVYICHGCHTTVWPLHTRLMKRTAANCCSSQAETKLLLIDWGCWCISLRPHNQETVAGMTVVCLTRYTTFNCTSAQLPCQRHTLTLALVHAASCRLQSLKRYRRSPRIRPSGSTMLSLGTSAATGDGELPTYKRCWRKMPFHSSVPRWPCLLLVVSRSLSC